MTDEMTQLLAEMRNAADMQTVTEKGIEWMRRLLRESADLLEQFDTRLDALVRLNDGSPDA